MTVITCDGVKFVPRRSGQLESQRGDTFRSSSQGTTPIIQSTELGESLKYLNDDSLEQETRMSGIDMRARLHYLEVQNVLALDTIVSLRILPTKCLAFTRQKKRLSVSVGGQGRKEMVEIVSGKKERDKEMSGGGFFDGVKSKLGMQK